MEREAEHLWAMHGKRGLNSKHIVKLVNKGSKQRLRERGKTFANMVTFPIPFLHLQKIIFHLILRALLYRIRKS